MNAVSNTALADAAAANADASAAARAARARRVRYVLVAPSHPGNVGAAARALYAMGFARLHVVAAREPAFATHADALAFASNATDVLADASIHASLAEALAGVRLAFAMTGYAREFGPPLVDLRSAAAQARAELDAAAEGDVAFVFGTERSGLANEDIERCTRCCAIPADAARGSLNLAQAVMVAAYECRLALVGACIEPVVMRDEEPPAPLDAVEGLHAHLERALVASGFLDPGEPRRLMSRLRRLFSRARPTATEVDILRGIAAALEQPKRERIGRKRAEPARG